MAKKNTGMIIDVKTLGGFSMSSGGQVVDDRVNRSKKVWALLEYLVLFHGKEVTQDNLIEMLWPEESSSNPANALKTLLHRVRATLEQLAPEGENKLLRQQRGSYFWNSDITFQVDADAFEALCQQAKGEKPEEAVRTYQQALEMYRGPFLPKSLSFSWVVPINAYYAALYQRAVIACAELFQESGRYAEMAEICRKAVEIDVYEESFHYYLIKALIETGDQKAAQKQYEQVCDLFFSKFGITPSKELTGLYKEVVKSPMGTATDLDSIRRDLSEQTAEGAFLCEYAFFKDIYRIQARSMMRTGESIFLGLITVNSKEDGELKQKVLNTAMQRLGEALQTALSDGDVYTRYSVEQYLVMLPSSSYERAEQALDRVVKCYRRDNTRSAITLHCALQPVEPSGNLAVIS